jgi:Xaa-Pro aminopeptidase
MKHKRLSLLVVLASITLAAKICGADGSEWKERRQRAAKAFPDGVLLLHAKTASDFVADGYREEARFYYFTGLENSPGAILAIDGRTGESWLFVPTTGSRATFEVQPGETAARQLGMEHVVDWMELESFLTGQARAGAKIYFKPETAVLPANLSATSDNRAPAWVQLLQKRWPETQFLPVGVKLDTLMAVESAAEQRASRAVAHATVAAFAAGAKAIRPGISQRRVELAVVDACWKEARGVSFWPWAMAGANAVFPKPFESDSRYDHLDFTMQSGDLVRLDVGCEWQHYQGDLGRTLPVSGRYTEEQREIWNIFTAAYRAAAGQLRAGATQDHIFEVWRAALMQHRETAKSSLAKQAIEKWSDRKNLPYWQLHTMNLDAGYIEGPLRAGMVIDFEPIADIGGQGYYLEDMYLISPEGAEVLTPGVPYTAEDIEAELTTRN